MTAGIDLETRIPVLIEGTAKELKWHVLGGAAPPGHHAHDGPRRGGTLAAAKITLVGFFSRHDEGVFTHIGQVRTHFHLITSSDRMTAHVEAFELEPGAVVHFPAR